MMSVNPGACSGAHIKVFFQKNKFFFFWAALLLHLKVHGRNFGEKRDPFEISFSQRKKKSKRREKKKTEG